MSTPTPTQKTITIGTRKSKLALLQTNLVLDALKKAFPQYEYKIFSKETAGDLNTTIALRDFNTKNLWTEELEELMIDGQVDIIVHSLKDVPTTLPSSCKLGPSMPREDSRDVLVVKQGLPYKSLSEIPAGSVVGTSSIRRTAQLARKYPHLKVQDVRGNIGTRLSKLDAEDSPYACIILAAAGLLRLDLADRITQYLDSKNSGMLYAVGQGALGIEIRKEDTVLHDMLDKIGHQDTTFSVLAERSLLRTLEGGCSAPLGVETGWVQNAQGAKQLRMRSVVVSVDGKECAQVELEADVTSAESAEAFGITVAKALVADGAGDILQAIQQNKAKETVSTAV
ncbi:porphobilinogen deaminase [Penicillium rubens]|uniref:Porphobilinogen deaminase n=3 Tax=Penicillium chrysogenum species complex TaxID=254878 RepID=B6HJQ4_PENRW|nr:porphobilinogen deaminase [Penicillium rubens]KAJ5049450.1 porphobilinogen deaminase [Penicillium rubens]KZN88438.1 Porphobilinogen deaminase [Penicillium chrysogenum]CAP95584.1 Pc21g06870 [Penicillium rubens Wisconsin 54-1255]